VKPARKKEKKKEKEEEEEERKRERQQPEAEPYLEAVIWQSAGLEIDIARSFSVEPPSFSISLSSSFSRALGLRLSFDHFSSGAKRGEEEEEEEKTGIANKKVQATESECR